MAEEAAAPQNQNGGSSTKLVLIIVVGAIFLVLASMAGIFFLLKTMGMLNAGGGAAGTHQIVQEGEPLDPPIYHALEPAFVVNFKERGRTRYLQIEIQVMTRDPEVIPLLDQHMPLIRNNLLLLFSGQDAEKLHSAEGKEALRTTALEEVQKVLMEQMGTEEPAIEALYFTSFVTQ